MKVLILETAHFQYALTQAEIFSDCDITIVTTTKMKNDMLEYAPIISSVNFHVIENIENNMNDILNLITDLKIDLFLISPVFDSYSSLKKIVKIVNCKKVITIHNINTWFNGKFWSPNSFMDRVNMKSIINNCDFIAVEDFIFNHLKSTNDLLYQKHKFIYIPFTIFHQNKIRKYFKETSQLKIILTGAIDGDRRRYEDVIEVIKYFANNDTSNITFSFAGKAIGDYGLMIQSKLREIKNSHPDLVNFFENDSTADNFRQEMETADLVLSTSTKTFKGMGTIEYIGKTKPTAAIHDMMTYELPGLLPHHLTVPENLLNSVFNYDNGIDLKQKLTKILDYPKILVDWKEKAKLNSLKFTAKEIRKGLPF